VETWKPVPETRTQVDFLATIRGSVRKGRARFFWAPTESPKINLGRGCWEKARGFSGPLLSARKSTWVRVVGVVVVSIVDSDSHT